MTVLEYLNLLKSKHSSYVSSESFNAHNIFGVMNLNVNEQLSLGSHSQQLKPNMHLIYKVE